MEEQKPRFRMLEGFGIDVNSKVSDKQRILVLLSILDEVSMQASSDLIEKNVFIMFSINDVLDVLYHELHTKLEENKKTNIDQLRTNAVNQLMTFYGHKCTECFFKTKLALEQLSLTLRAEVAKQLNELESEG